MSQEFRINELITLRLENNETVIYIDGDRFRQCKYLLLNINISTENIDDYDDLNSIDEAAEVLDRSLEGKKYIIPPKTEFWGHCSNLQAWYENNYDTRLIHSNLAFPLLYRLTKAGDPLAKKVFKDEIARRFASGYLPVINYLLEKKYLKYLNQEEIDVLIDDLEDNLDNLLEASSFSMKNFDNTPFSLYLGGLARKYLLINGNFNKAIKILKLILKISPEDAKTWRVLCTAYLKNDQQEEAISAMRKALKFNPDLEIYFKTIKIFFKL